MFVTLARLSIASLALTFQEPPQIVSLLSSTPVLEQTCECSAAVLIDFAVVQQVPWEVP